jgi:hypothetical protein
MISILPGHSADPITSARTLILVVPAFELVTGSTLRVHAVVKIRFPSAHKRPFPQVWHRFWWVR